MPELIPDVKIEFEKLVKEAMDIFDLDKPEPCIVLLKKAWDLLPVKKEEYSESFNVMKYLTYIHLRRKEFSLMMEYARIFLYCDVLRADGEQEFLYAIACFELGEPDEARKYFAIADKKSEGRRWEDADMKYFKFFKSK